MRLLLDAHAFLWWLTGSRALSTSARQAVADPGNEVLIGIGTLWELTIKRSLRKLNFPHDLETVVRDEGFAVIGITLAHLRMLETLPHVHRDPFDRLLIAQSLADHVPIITGDRAFGAYGTTLIW
jgi:PIN domain nuclease of toxin-antitoxin system